MKQEIQGVFQICGWEETQTLEAPAPQKHTYVKAKKRYESGWSGESDVEFLLCYIDDQTTEYSGFERFSGNWGEREGSVVLACRGTYREGQAQEEGTIVEGTGTGGLAGLVGTLRYTARHEEKHNYTFTYEWRDNESNS